jgi:hypothetical protein
MADTDKVLNTLKCFTSKAKLFDIYESGKVIRHISYGVCTLCENHFASDQLVHPAGHRRDAWPIAYVGLMCKSCDAKHLSTPS